MATIILKCTERCNSNCVYCDVIRTHAGCVDMPLDLLELVFYRINEYLLRHSAEDVLITWHGGEPLLLGYPYFEKASQFQAEYCSRTHKRIRHAIQSNLTLLTADFIPIFRRLGIDSVGSSYDPDPHIRGMGRTRDTQTYNRAFLRATSLLEKNGMNWGIIYVVTKRTLLDPIATFNLLANLAPGGGFTMNPVIISDKSLMEFAITPNEYADFLGVIFSVWYTHRNRFGKVEPFSSLLSNVTGQGRRLSCEDSGLCAKRHWNIDSTGNVSQCGRSSDLGIMNWGNIREMSIDEMMTQNGQLELETRSRRLKETDCKECNLFPICHGGCPIDAYVAYGNMDRKTGWCNAKKRFIAEYFEPVTSLKVENLMDCV
jgi:uncharacterized protein